MATKKVAKVDKIQVIFNHPVIVKGETVMGGTVITMTEQEASLCDLSPSRVVAFRATGTDTKNVKTTDEFGEVALIDKGGNPEPEPERFTPEKLTVPQAYSKQGGPTPKNPPANQNPPADPPADPNPPAGGDAKGAEKADDKPKK